jgi:acyl-CoA reductase-like NAD-dependent aldehyde dehydrogenase
LRAAEILIRDQKVLGEIALQEPGEVSAMFDFEHNLAVQVCKSTAGLISAIRGSVPTISDPKRSAMVVREPYGVVLAVAPWNAPFVLGFRSFIGPLAMGNTVIMKGSESCPGIYYKIVSIMREAGLPDGCLNTINHRPQDAAEITSAIISSPQVRKINFTGSSLVGSIIASQAAKYLKPVLLELGGKAPTIICEDADLQEAAVGATLGSFLNSGQICMSTERLIIHAAVADRFKEMLKQTIEQIFGNTEGLTLINPNTVTKNRKLLQDAISKGAKALHGDPNHTAAINTAMRPVVIEGVNEGMDIHHNESFGPTVSLYIVQDDDEAVKLANDTDYGLTASIYTEDLRRGLRIARKLQSGAIHINGMSVHDESALPHGGFKSSGYGRFNSIEGLEEWVQTKTITWKN